MKNKNRDFVTARGVKSLQALKVPNPKSARIGWHRVPVMMMLVCLASVFAAASVLSACTGSTAVSSKVADKDSVDLVGSGSVVSASSLWEKSAAEALSSNEAESCSSSGGMDATGNQCGIDPVVAVEDAVRDEASGIRGEGTKETQNEGRSATPAIAFTELN